MERIYVKKNTTCGLHIAFSYTNRQNVCISRTQVHNGIKNVLVVFGYNTIEGVTSCKAVSFRQSIIVSGDMRRLKNDSLMSTIFYQHFFSFQAVFWKDAPATTDTTATTTTTEDIEETRESRKKQHHHHHHRKQQKKQHRSQENTRPITEPGHTGTLPRSSVRRSTSCRRETEPPMRPMTTHNIMSMSMIGKLLKSFSNLDLFLLWFCSNMCLL